MSKYLGEIASGTHLVILERFFLSHVFVNKKYQSLSGCITFLIIPASSSCILSIQFGNSPAGEILLGRDFLTWQVEGVEDWVTLFTSRNSTCRYIKIKSILLMGVRYQILLANFNETEKVNHFHSK